MIHSSIIVYTYIWYFDYYSTVLRGKLAVATGHGMLISSEPENLLLLCKFQSIVIINFFRNSLTLFLQSIMNTEIFA